MLNRIFKKKNTPYFIIVILLVWVAYQYLAIASLKSTELYLYSYVPHVELSSTKYQSGSETLFHITGFVKFNNTTDQPRRLWQYQIIEPSNKIDGSGNRIYLLTDIIKLDYVPPRYFEPVEIKEVQDTGSLVTFTDEAGNIFRINKLTEEVSVQDTTGDSTTLITNENDYKDFMREFLRGEQ
ncbi:MAG: hypothetical protein AMXMBFR44_4500 [Candidatus Campbellbacteria bacterium]